MSLINQMLRDLEERKDGQSAVSNVSVLKPARPAGRLALGRRLRNMPPILWVGAGGMLGIAAVLWGSGLLSSPAVPEAPSPRPANVASPSTPVAAPVSPAPVIPPAASVSRPVAPAPASSAAVTAPRLAVAKPVPSAPRREPGASASGSAPVARRQLSPEQLPGAVTVAGSSARPAPAELSSPAPATPYGQADAAYRQGRRAYLDSRSDEATTALHRALQLYPGHLPARELLAAQYGAAGRSDEAISLLQEGLAIAPDYAPFRKRIARLLLADGDAAGAVRALLGSGLPTVAADPELHQLLAGAYRQLGENFLAAQTWRNLLVHDPQRAAYWVGLGDALAVDGQPGEAHKAYRKALALGGLSPEEAARLRGASSSR